MLTFFCSSCKQSIQAADDLVGKSILCPHCGFATTVASSAITTTNALPTYPASTAVTTADVVEAAEQSRRRAEAEARDAPGPNVTKPAVLLPSLLKILVAISIISILIALCLPPVERVREAAARTQSVNNLKNIALAFHGFHDANKRLPFNGSDLPFKDEKYQAEAGAGNSQSGSWTFQILPFIDQGPLYSGGNGGADPKPGLPFNTTIPANLRTMGLFQYMCPGRGRPLFEVQGGAWTDYFYNNYLNDPKQASKPDAADARRTLIDITDGSSNTVLVGHGSVSTIQYGLNANVTLSTNIFRGGTTGTMRAGNNGEKSPGGVTLQPDSEKLPTAGSWGGPFPQGALIAMGDATVRMFPYSMQNFSDFLTPTGGEVVTLPDT